MSAMTVRDAVEALRQSLESDPARAVVHLRTEAELVGLTEVSVRMGNHTVTVDEPKSVGGTGVAANPVQLVLGTLGSCQAITYRYWAEMLGIKLDGVTVRVEGDFDMRGIFGFDPDASPGLAAVTCAVTLHGPEDPARYRDLAAVVDAHCPVLDLFSRPVPVERTVEIAGG
jgi:uncharacterized OsmC-like protein